MVQLYVSPKKISGPDPILAADQLQALKTLYNTYGLDHFCQQFIWILKKKPEPEDPKPKGAWNKRLVPFVPNDIQTDFHANRIDKNIVLKGRQFGITTDGIITELLIPAILEAGFSGLLISQTNSYGAQHFQILQRAFKYFGKVIPFLDQHPRNLFWQQLHEHLLHTKYSARREIVFDVLDSRVLVDSAEKTEVGQGLPGISALWATEVPRWPHNPEETLANAKEAVHQDGRITLEGTANSMGGYFYEEVQRAKEGKDAEFKYFFYEWFKHKEYKDRVAADPKTLTDQEKELRRKFQLSLEQITWRRKKMISLRAEFFEKYPEDDISCFLLSGMPFLDQQNLLARAREIKGRQPYMISDDGAMVFFHRRNKNHRYVIGADPARGIMINNTDTDRCAAVVLDEETGEEVAAFADRLPPEDFALALMEMAKTYNNAMIAVERTGDGATVMLQLDHEGYSNIYKHKEWIKDEKTVVEIAGWPPTTLTRPIACNRFAAIVREHPETINDEAFFSEGYAFQRGKDGRPAASPGAHDDRVSCRYIAHYVRLVNLGYLDPIMMNRERYGADAEAA